jgi:hypothetical protein
MTMKSVSKVSRALQTLFSQNAAESSAQSALVGIFAVWTVAWASLAIGLNPVNAAEDLSLRPGLSFTQDIDNGFPILGKSMEDMAVSTGKPVFIFFGSSGDLNTNRQAKRVVDLYHKADTRTLKFIIVDVDNPPNDLGKALIKKYYKGYVPSQVLLDKEGKLIWDQTGETDTQTLKNQLDKVSKS